MIAGLAYLFLAILWFGNLMAIEDMDHDLNSSLMRIFSYLDMILLFSMIAVSIAFTIQYKFFREDDLITEHLFSARKITLGSMTVAYVASTISIICYFTIKYYLLVILIGIFAITIVSDLLLFMIIRGKKLLTSHHYYMHDKGSDNLSFWMKGARNSLMVSSITMLLVVFLIVSYFSEQNLLPNSTPDIGISVCCLLVTITVVGVSVSIIGPTVLIRRVIKHMQKNRSPEVDE